MFIKPRFKSKELRILTALNNRMDLPEKEKQQYLNQLKGFEGELEFDRRISMLETETLVLADLLLEVNGSIFQIDTLVIFQETLYLFEVKNYEGDYYYEDGKLRFVSGKEITDPILQRNRCESLLRQLLNTLGYTCTLKACVIFINSEFTMYQAPKDQHLVLPTQMNRFMKTLDNIKSKTTVRNTKLAEKLLSLHLTESPMKREYQYEYGKLRKGVFSECGQRMHIYNRAKLICATCGETEHIEAAILRNVDEFKLLFPEEKVTTQRIFDWCGDTIPARTIQRYLMKNFKVKGVKNWTYYE